MREEPARPTEGEGADGGPDASSPDALPTGTASLDASRPPDWPGLKVSGEISASTVPAWQEVLEQLVGQPGEVCRADLSQVTFVDVAGVTNLVLTAQSLPSGRRIVLHRPPPQLPRILELFWPGLTEIEVAS